MKKTMKKKKFGTPAIFEAIFIILTLISMPFMIVGMFKDYVSYERQEAYLKGVKDQILWEEEGHTCEVAYTILDKIHSHEKCYGEGDPTRADLRK